MSAYAGRWDVSVGNLGTVVRSATEHKARAAFQDYRAQADAHRFRASHPVVLWFNGEPVAETPECSECQA